MVPVSPSTPAQLEAETGNEGAQAEAGKRKAEQIEESLSTGSECSEVPEATEQLVAIVEEMVSSPAENKAEDKTENKAETRRKSDGSGRTFGENPTPGTR